MEKKMETTILYCDYIGSCPDSNCKYHGCSLIGLGFRVSV